jgi:predicted RND superfamily exporter protein
MNKTWNWIANQILAYKIGILITISALTVAFIYEASQIQLSYELAKILPKTDERFQLYESFKKKYGEDGNIMVIGLENPEIFTPTEFDAWNKLYQDVKHQAGIKSILALPNLPILYLDSSANQFKSKLAYEGNDRSSQVQLNQLKDRLAQLPIYRNFLYTEDLKVHMMLITLDQKTINNKSRITLVKNIKKLGDDYAQRTKHPVHYSGMPFIRTELTAQVTNELVLFLGLAIFVTSLILFYFFRSVKVVFFALIVILIGIVASLATIVFFGYKITLLSGLIPPLIVVIGVPNAIFLLNKYHETYLITQNKEASLIESTGTVGRTLFLANLTTSIGFGVFAFTGSALLVEFGVVAALNVMLTFLLSLLLIPIFFSYLNPPKAKDLAHFESKKVNKVLAFVETWVFNHRRYIYGIIGIILSISLYGLTKG